ncbi:MAG: hypothetical protein ABFS16_05315 [Bacteroidota bacterium]
MLRKSKQAIKSDFKRDIPEYCDEAILDILKKRDHYQPEAAQLAIQEAIKRGLINSEQDLFAEEYQIQPLRFSVFPIIEDEKNRNRIRRSIARVLVICGALPTVWGIVKLNENEIIEGSLVLLFGLLWIYLTARLMKKHNRINVYLMFGALFISAIYLTGTIFITGNITFIDVFIPVVIAALTVYGLLFMGRLADKK